MLQENLRLDPKSERDLIRAYRLFKRTDTNGDGKIQKSEFAKAFRLDTDVFFDRLFALIDTDNSGYVDFREFVIVLAAFQLSNASGRVRFAFRLMDLDDSGAVDKEEFRAMIQASVGMFRTRTKEGRKRAGKNDWRDKAPKDIYAAYKDLFAKLDRSPGKAIGYNDFADMCVKYPKLFTPANYIWNTLRRYAVPAAELCKVIARGGHRAFFYNSMLEHGWPGVKFSAPPLALADRKVYMRSLSNLFKRKGSVVDNEDARMTNDRGGAASRSYEQDHDAGRRSRSRHSNAEMGSPTKHRDVHYGSQENECRDDRRYEARRSVRGYHPEDHVERRHSLGVPRTVRGAGSNDPGPRGSYSAPYIHNPPRHVPPQKPKFVRQFSWGNDDPNSELGRRELLASNSIEKAYREEYPAEEEQESWLDDDMRESTSNLKDRTFDKQDSIDEIWEALQACPSAKAAQYYTPDDYVPDEYYKRLDDGVYYKKNYAANTASGIRPPVYQHERQ